MSSKLDRRAGLTFSLRLTLWYALFLAMAAIAVYFASARLLHSAMEHEWEINHESFEQGWRRDAGSHAYELISSRERTWSALPPAVRAQIERHFASVFPVMIVPILLLALLGGLLWTFRTTLPLRRLARTVRGILATGELDRRVQTGSGRGELDELIALFNRMLERNESLVRAMRSSLDNVAHDLRTPMTRLRATAETALQHPDDPRACPEAIADCLEESEQVLRLLDSLMDVAEAEAGTMRLSTEAVSIPVVVRSVIDLYELVAEDKDVRVATELPDELLVSADPDRLRQAFANLLDNAIKYGSGGSTVTIRASVAGDEAIVEFTDQGPGIDPIDLPHIWERLYRGDRSRGERGLGLGLSFVRAIIEAHHGQVEVDSEPGRGATFRVRLPRPLQEP